MLIRAYSSPRFNLSVLRMSLHIPQAIVGGFVDMQVNSVIMLSACGQLKHDCTASSNLGFQCCVTELLSDYFGS